MLMNPLSRRNLLSLRAAIKGMSEESVILRKKKAKKTKVLDKAILSMDKCYLGWNIRYHQLAYGLLRGLDYNQLEKNTERKMTLKDAVRIHNILKTYNIYYGSFYLKDENEVLKWLEGTRFFLTPQEMAAKIEAQKQRYQELTKRMEEQRRC